MGFLRKPNEDPIETVKRLLEGLKDIKYRLNEVSSKLEQMKQQSSIDADEYERLYGKEFELSMTLSDFHQEIYKILDYAKTSQNEFVIKRLKQEADKIFTPVYLEI